MGSVPQSTEMWEPSQHSSSEQPTRFQCEMETPAKIYELSALRGAGCRCGECAQKTLTSFRGEASPKGNEGGFVRVINAIADLWRAAGPPWVD